MSSAKLGRVHGALLSALDLGIAQTCDPALLELSAPAVSGWSVKDHLEHLSVANDGILEWVEGVAADDSGLDKGGRSTLVGRIVLLVGTIPRGRAEAPKTTRPTGSSAEDLEARWRGTRERVQRLSDTFPQLLTSKATRNHFMFGHLNAAQWLRFMEVHNRHHQKIIRDIRAVT